MAEVLHKTTHRLHETLLNGTRDHSNDGAADLLLCRSTWVESDRDVHVVMKSRQNQHMEKTEMTVN